MKYFPKMDIVKSNTDSINYYFITYIRKLYKKKFYTRQFGMFYVNPLQFTKSQLKKDFTIRVNQTLLTITVNLKQKTPAGFKLWELDKCQTGKESTIKIIK